MKEYQISKEDCAKHINGVCKQCGGELDPIETVDNAGNPTYWAGCNQCLIFCNGIPKEVYDIAVKMVDERHFVCYRHMDNPKWHPTTEDEINYAKYYREVQIGGTTDVVRDILWIQKTLTHDSQPAIN